MGEVATDLPVNKLQDQPYHELYKSAKEEVPMLALQACQAEYYLTAELKRTLHQQHLSKSMISPISPFQLLVVFALVMCLTAKSQARSLSQSPSTRITLK